MIDFHSHILYGVDDGAKDEEMSLEMLKIAELSGTFKIVATPHYVRGRFQVPRDEINQGVINLRKLANENNIALEIYEGQEVYYTENILTYYDEGVINTIGNTKYMLIELPMRNFHLEEVLDNLYEIQVRGIVIILAHPERYEKFIKAPYLINRFIDEGFLFQLNIGSITGNFGKEVEKTAEIFIKNRVYTVVGSDGHRSEGRTTDMRKGITKIEKFQPGYMKDFEEKSEKILENAQVSFDGQKIQRKKGLFGLFKKDRK